MAKSLMKKIYHKAALALCLTVAAAAGGTFANFDQAYAASPTDSMAAENFADKKVTFQQAVVVPPGIMDKETSVLSICYISDPTMHQGDYAAFLVSKSGEVRMLKNGDLGSVRNGSHYFKAEGHEFSLEPTKGEYSVDGMPVHRLAEKGIDFVFQAVLSKVGQGNKILDANQGALIDLIHYVQGKGIGVNTSLDDGDQSAKDLVSVIGIKGVKGEMDVTGSGKKPNIAFIDFSNDVGAATALVGKIKGAENVGEYTNPETGKHFAASVKLPISEFRATLMGALDGANPAMKTNYTSGNKYNPKVSP